MSKRKQMRYPVILAFVLAVLLVATVVLGYTHHRAKAIGDSVGKISGNLVGTAIGSFNGVTDGIAKGKEDGEKAGLSAEDTTVDIKGTVVSMGKLEVLVAGVSLKNINKIGEAYEGVYIISGDAVFSVDLKQAEIGVSQDTKTITVSIPDPELTVYLDQNSTKTLSEEINFSWNVNAEDGLRAFLNSMVNTVDKVKDTIANYDQLLELAKEAAKNQVYQVVSMVSDKEYTVLVQFK